MPKNLYPQTLFPMVPPLDFDNSLLECASLLLQRSPSLDDTEKACHSFRTTSRVHISPRIPHQDFAIHEACKSGLVCLVKYLLERPTSRAQMNKPNSDEVGNRKRLLYQNLTELEGSSRPLPLHGRRDGTPGRAQYIHRFAGYSSRKSRSAHL